MKRKNTTRNALFTSIISLLLCVSMLVGTTFAWFTDTVKSGNNIIKAGNLDIGVEYYDAEAKEWNDVTGASDLFSKELWEPGHTQVVYLKISNLGTLALKYALGINIIEETPGYSVEEAPFMLSDYINMGVVELDAETFYAEREDAVDAVAEFNAIKAGYSYSDKMVSAGQAATAELSAPVKYLAVVVHMPTTVGNEANYKTGTTPPSIDLGINVYATQQMHEDDSFGNDYDENASAIVKAGDDLKAAIESVEDGGIIVLENGVHNVPSGPIVIEGKTVTVIGMGEVTINKNYGSTHIFTIKNGANVTIENITMDGKGNTREGVYVRWNSEVTLKDCVIKNTGGKDIMIDEGSDAAHGENTASYVWLYNTQIEDVAMCASPVTTVAATQDTYVYFNYDVNSKVGAIDVQGINKKPENIIINGVASDKIGETMNLYVKNDAELAEALNTIKTNEAYWNKQVYVYLAAGIYSGDHVINQYPQWNGVVGAGATANNYASGVTAGAPGTVITFVGETASTFARGAQAVPAVIFTGNVTVNGFGNAGTGFGTATATTVFQNIAFDGANSADESDAADAVVVYVLAAANNVSFEGCTFVNATHVTLGGSSANGVGLIEVTGCTFNDGGCLSGYVETLNVKDTLVTAAKNGFINKSKGGNVTVTDCDITAGKYFIRTSNSGVKLTVKDSKIAMYESEGKKDLVYFRGSNESAEFINCTIAAGYTTAGVDANSTLKIVNIDEQGNGVIYTSNYGDLADGRDSSNDYILIGDVAADDFIYFGDNTTNTIDLNGKTITAENKSQWLFVSQGAGCAVTLKGDGVVKAEKGVFASSSGKLNIDGGNYQFSETNEKGNLYVQNSATLVINGGEFISNDANTPIAYCINGFIEINGGFFQNTANPSQALLSMGNNLSYINNQKITLSGGTFVNWNPMDSAFARPWTNPNVPALIVLADGYQMTSETQANGDIWYTIVPVA